MKIIPLDNISHFSLPLPIYTSVHLADAIGKDGEEFSVFAGLEKKYAEQLREYSLNKQDIDLQENTGDYARFGKGSYAEWYGKSRTPFCVIHKRTDTLAALIWLGPKTLGKKSIKFGAEEADEMQDHWHTISVRSYVPFRGKGIMFNFVKFAIDIYKSKFPYIMLWSGMAVDNKAVVKLFTALGFEVDEENSDLGAHWQVMIKK